MTSKSFMFENSLPDNCVSRIPDTSNLGLVVSLRNGPPAAQELSDDIQAHELHEKREPQPDSAQAIVMVRQEEILRPGVILPDGTFACTCSRSLLMTIVTSQAKNVAPSTATNSTTQAPTNSTSGVSETSENVQVLTPSTDPIATENPSPTGTESDVTSPADETPADAEGGAGDSNPSS